MLLSMLINADAPNATFYNLERLSQIISTILPPQIILNNPAAVNYPRIIPIILPLTV